VTTDPNGVRTETRVFRDNPRISRVVVTTRDGQRTAKAYSPSGEEREINDVGDALSATGDAIANSAGFVADKTEDAIDETADKAEDVAGETKDAAKTVGDKTVKTAEKVGDKTAQGAKTVGKKTADAAKKTGSKIKDAITP
jgi:gas vesicle protein